EAGGVRNEPQPAHRALVRKVDLFGLRSFLARGAAGALPRLLTDPGTVVGLQSLVGAASTSSAPRISSPASASTRCRLCCGGASSGVGSGHISQEPSPREIR